jgi:hypothetical protein
MYALAVVATSASLLLSSCNASNDEVNNSKGKNQEQLPTLTISGKISQFVPSSIDSLRAYDDKNINFLGACPVASDGSFKITITPKFTASDSIGRIWENNKYYSGFNQWFPNSRLRTSNNNATCMTISNLFAYKNGKYVTSICNKYSYLYNQPDTIFAREKKIIYIYCNSIINISKTDSLDLNLFNSFNYQLKNGWTEICNEFEYSNKIDLKNNINRTKLVMYHSDNIPNDVEWLPTDSLTAKSKLYQQILMNTRVLKPGV